MTEPDKLWPEYKMKLSAALVLQLLLLRVNFSSSLGFYTYTVQIVQVEVLPPEEKLIIDFSDIRVVGRERSINGTVHILEDMDAETCQMSVDLLHDPNGNGQWKAMLFGLPVTDICFAMRFLFGTYGKTTLQVGVKTNLPFDGEHCPVPKGSYYLKNVLVNSESWPAIIPYGELKANVRFYKLGKPAGGFSTTLNIEKKLCKICN